MLEREAPQRVVIDALAGVEAVASARKSLPLRLTRGAVREMAAMSERHAQESVAGLEYAKYTAWFACEPECGCTLAYSAP